MSKPTRLPVVPKWQDLVLAIGSVVFILGLLPSVLGNGKPEPVTSFSTAIVLYVFCSVYISYRLWLTLGLVLITATLWLILGIQAL